MCLSCSEDDPVNPISLDDKKEDEMYQSILEETGCRVENADNIATFRYHTDTINNFKYLYGSRNDGEYNCFWFSKYDASGNLVWDKQIEHETISVKGKIYNCNAHAYSFEELSNNNLVSSLIYEGDLVSIVEADAVILDQSTGDVIKKVRLAEGYIFDHIYSMTDYFYTYISQSKLDLTSNAWKETFRIANNGKTINSTRDLTSIPPLNSIISSDTTFITIDKNNIAKASIFGDNYWNNYVNNLSSWDYEIAQDTLQIAYGESESRDTLYIELTTGEIINDTIIGAYNFCEIGKTYIARDSLTVTLNNIAIRSNGAGTNYYTIDYTLINRTKDKSITEGAFKMFYKYQSGGENQTGFFSKLYPGESIHRTYSFKSLEAEPFYILEYDHDNFFNAAPIEGSMKWEISY